MVKMVFDKSGLKYLYFICLTRRVNSYLKKCTMDGWISFCAKTGKASKQEHVCPLAHIGFTVEIGLDYRPCSTNGTAGMCPSFTSFNSSTMF